MSTAVCRNPVETFQANPSQGRLVLIINVLALVINLGWTLSILGPVMWKGTKKAAKHIYHTHTTLVPVVWKRGKQAAKHIYHLLNTPVTIVIKGAKKVTNQIYYLLTGKYRVIQKLQKEKDTTAKCLEDPEKDLAVQKSEEVCQCNFLNYLLDRQINSAKKLKNAKDQLIVISKGFLDEVNRLRGVLTDRDRVISELQTTNQKLRDTIDRLRGPKTVKFTSKTSNNDTCVTTYEVDYKTAKFTEFYQEFNKFSGIRH